jgi:predicted RNase H-like nuclease (RuvC/YqgF family)
MPLPNASKKHIAYNSYRAKATTLQRQQEKLKEQQEELKDQQEALKEQQEELIAQGDALKVSAETQGQKHIAYNSYRAKATTLQRQQEKLKEQQEELIKQQEAALKASVENQGQGVPEASVTDLKANEKLK